jgi:hypothetical protein
LVRIKIFYGKPVSQEVTLLLASGGIVFLLQVLKRKRSY